MAEIRLQGDLVALVDDADLLRVSGDRWYADAHGYAVRTTDKKKIHTFLTGWPLVDHINGNRLDNRRENLREATHQQNSWNQGLRTNNTSGYKGVHFHKGARRWRAQIHFNGKCHYLGYFDTPEEAALAYDRAASERFGEFARLNNPEVVPGGDD